MRFHPELDGSKYLPPNVALPDGWAALSPDDGFALAESGADVMAWFASDPKDVEDIIKDPTRGWTLRLHLPHAYEWVQETQYRLYLFVQVE